MQYMHKPVPLEGSHRIVKRFLLFPKRIGDSTRWLSTETWEEVAHYRVWVVPGMENLFLYMRFTLKMELPKSFDRWEATRWIDAPLEEGEGACKEKSS